MWQLYMVLIMGNGFYMYGGPMVMDGFTSKENCLAHAEKIKKSTPPDFFKSAKRLQKTEPFNVFKHVDCIKIDY